MQVSAATWYQSLSRGELAGLRRRGLAVREEAAKLAAERKKDEEELERKKRELYRVLISKHRDRRTVERILSRHSGEFMRAYTRRLKHRPGLTGTVRFSFLIRPDGVPDSVRVAYSSLKDERLESEVTEILTTVQFEPVPAQVGATRHEYLIPFVPVADGSKQGM
jgi:TonB family protein